MRRRTMFLGGPLVLGLWCGAGGGVPAHASTPAASHAARATTTTVAPTTLPIETVPSTTGSGTPDASAPTGKILMVKLYVGSVDAGEKFYGAVFGAKLAVKVGSAHIVTFPDGGPGLVLLKKAPDEKKKQGSFIIQVPDLSASQALAIDHGAKQQAKFAGNPGSQAAKSIDMLDPWGNQFEILQIG